MSGIVNSRSIYHVDVKTDRRYHWANINVSVGGVFRENFETKCHENQRLTQNCFICH